ncbi:MAG: protein BatD, partial [bacterium]|nr:protein BatD [bacterium]
EAPQLASSEYYKVFPAKVTKDSHFEIANLSGSLEAEIPISFKNTGVISFPTIDFKYFDPGSARVVTLKSKPFTVHVAGLKEKHESAVSIPQTEIIKKGEDIDFIKKGNVYDQSMTFYKTDIFKVLLWVFFLFNLLYLLKAVIFDHLIAGSSLLKKKKLLSKILGDLKNVKEYGAISPILEEYLKVKAGLGLSEVSNQSIETLLSAAKVEAKDIKAFIKIKSDSELSRFAPPGMDNGAGPGREASRGLKNDLKQLVDILKRIDGRLK